MPSLSLSLFLLLHDLEERRRRRGGFFFVVFLGVFLSSRLEKVEEGERGRGEGEINRGSYRR